MGLFKSSATPAAIADLQFIKTEEAHMQPLVVEEIRSVE